MKIETRNRNQLAAVAGAAIGVAGIGAVRRARHRARGHGAAQGNADVTPPTVAGDRPPTAAPDGGDQAHAPGHRHLPMTAHLRGGRPPRGGGARPFAKHRHGLRHPGRG